MSKAALTGASLAAARRAVGLSQEALAHAAGVSATTISRAERGITVPRPSQMAAIETAIRHAEHAERIAPRKVGPIPEWRPCSEPRDEDGDVLAYHVPPECGGQIVERAYAIHGDSLYRRISDRSDRSDRYEVREIGPAEEPEPWNREPR